MAGKISEMTAAAVGDLDAAASDLEVSINVTTVPVTRRSTFQVLVDWLLQVGLLARMAPITVNNAASPYAVPVTASSLLVTTAGGAVTVTLPAAPTAGRILSVKRTTTDANAVTIARNTKNIEGAAADLVLGGGNTASVTLQYDATSTSWWIV